MTNVNKNIINQKPMVRILRKAKKPKYWSNSNISSSSITKIQYKLNCFADTAKIFKQKAVFLCRRMHYGISN